MRRIGIAFLLLLLHIGGAARAEVELAVGPNIQVNRGSAADGSFGTGFLARALHSRTPAHAMGFSFEGLWLMPTNDETASMHTQQDLVFVNRLRPPVGLKESLGIDLGAGVTHFSGAQVTYHPTFQLGASISGRLAGPLRFEIGARLSMTPNVFYPDADEPFSVPATAAWRFGGVVLARL